MIYEVVKYDNDNEVYVDRVGVSSTDYIVLNKVAHAANFAAVLVEAQDREEARQIADKLFKGKA